MRFNILAPSKSHPSEFVSGMIVRTSITSLFDVLWPMTYGIKQLLSWGSIGFYLIQWMTCSWRRWLRIGGRIERRFCGVVLGWLSSGFFGWSGTTGLLATGEKNRIMSCGIE